jgi:hypothetical protein
MTVAQTRRQPGGGLKGNHVVITDELLDHLAERFSIKQIRELTRCTFEQYIVRTEAWERIAEALRDGWGVRYHSECPELVALIPPVHTSSVH